LAYLGVFTDRNIDISVKRINRAAQELPKRLWLRLYYKGVDPDVIRGIRAFSKLDLTVDNNFSLF